MPVGRCPRLPDPQGRRGLASPAGAGRTSPGRSARDRFDGGHNAPAGRWPGLARGSRSLQTAWVPGSAPSDRGSLDAPAPGLVSEGRGRRPSARGGIGRDCSQCRPPVSARLFGRVVPPIGAPEVGEEGRSPTRPVLKHGPRSLTRARVAGSVEACGRSEGEGRPGPPEVGSRRPAAAGAPPADLVRPVGEVEQERTRWDPKDGELCLSRTKPEETLVEVRSDSDVQIDRRTWV